MALNEKEIAEKLIKEYDSNRKKSDAVFTELYDKLGKLNKTTERKTTPLYNKVISSLILDDNGSVATVNSNYVKVRQLMNGLDVIQISYRKKFGTVYDEARNELMAVASFKNRKTGVAIKLLGDKKQRTKISKENLKVLNKIHMQGFKQINTMLKKWKDFAYDMFYLGITKGLTPINMKALFYNDNGSLKIGSSLEEESEIIAGMNLVEERTNFVQQKAEENGYTYCWNSNPIDPRTKPECLEASMAGVISEAEMGTDHGFPPRFICRCDLVYVRPEWVKLNAAINKSLDSRRVSLVKDLDDYPKQKTKWLRNGKWVFPKDPLRRKGKVYKNIAEKKVLAQKLKVPKYAVTDKQMGEFLDLTRKQYGLDVETILEMGGAAALAKLGLDEES